MKISEIALNKRIPLEINFVRVIVLIILCLIVKSLKTSDFWRQPYSKKSFKQNLVLVLIIDIGILTMYFINNGCSDYSFKDIYNDNLVKALSNGEVAISDTPDIDKLEELNNPYDAIERSKLDRDIDYIWDAAYFNQKYYVYFGVGPALLLMVPYHLITNKLMSSAMAILIFSLLSIPVLVLLTRKIFLKFFKEEQFKYMALSSLLMIFGTMLIWINVAPRFYELVTVARIFLCNIRFFACIRFRKR